MRYWLFVLQAFLFSHLHIGMFKLLLFARMSCLWNVSSWIKKKSCCSWFRASRCRTWRWEDICLDVETFIWRHDHLSDCIWQYNTKTFIFSLARKHKGRPKRSNSKSSNPKRSNSKGSNSKRSTEITEGRFNGPFGLSLHTLRNQLSRQSLS